MQRCTGCNEVVFNELRMSSCDFHKLNMEVKAMSKKDRKGGCDQTITLSLN